MLIYYVLIPLTIIDGAAMGYLSLLTSLNQTWLPFIFLIGFNILPLWAIFSRYSKNIIFDELLFNFCLIGSYLITVALLDNTNAFSLVNWLGLLIAFVGFILMKLTWEEKKS